MAELPLLVDDGNQSYLHGAGPLAQIDAAGTRYDLLADGLGQCATSSTAAAPWWARQIIPCLASIATKPA